MKKRKKTIILFLAIILLSVFLIRAAGNLKSAMEIFAKTEGNAALSLMMQNALYGILATQEEEYVTIVRDASMHVSSIQIHSVELSLLASKLTIHLLELLQTYRNSEFGIPLGNLTSCPVLSGRGPLVPVRPVAAGNIANEIQSSFQSAGINQTLHRVSLRFVATICYLSPLYEVIDTVTIDLIIAETLVVGNVPIYRD